MNSTHTHTVFIPSAIQIVFSVSGIASRSVARICQGLTVSFHVCRGCAAHQCTEDTLALRDGGHLLQGELAKAQFT